MVGLNGSHSPAALVDAILAGLTATIAFIAFEQLVGLDRLGWGPCVALLGGVLMVAARRGCCTRWARRNQFEAVDGSRW